MLAFNLSLFWNNLQELVREENVLSVAAAVYAATFLVWLYLPHERAHVRRTFWMFTLALVLLLGSVVVSTLELAPAANPLYWAGLMLGGAAMINLIGMLTFEGLLRLLHISTPRIARDLLIAMGYLGVGLTLLSRAGLSISGLVTTSAVLTAVIGFSLQDTLGNIMGGLALQTDKSIQVGDWIKVDQNVGRVTEIRWRHTAIETRNWETVIIPNGVLMKAQVTVLGRRTDQAVQLRRWVYFNVDFRTSPTEVIQTVLDALLAEPIPGVAAEPKLNCIFYEFKDSYAVYALRYWLTDLANDDPTDSLVRTRIYFALKRANIPLSIPAQSVFVTEDSQTRKVFKSEQEINHRLATLNRVELFHNLTDPEKRALAEHMRTAPFTKGEAITRQGSDAHWLYILTKGSAEVDIQVDGAARRAIATLREGDFFGEMSLMTGAKRSATIIAREDSECYRLDKEAFHEILHQRPELAEQISHILAHRQVGLETAREGLDAEARQTRVNHAQGDILARIKDFFSLGNHK
ncbi:MAG: cyclic nucleotide-binding domain-containing protein [Verrucomicrobiota bacterium]